MDKPGSWFLLAKCIKNTCGRVKNITLPQVFFKHFPIKNQLPGFYISETLVENGLKSHFRLQWSSSLFITSYVVSRFNKKKIQSKNVSNHVAMPWKLLRPLSMFLAHRDHSNGLLYQSTDWFLHDVNRGFHNIFWNIARVLAKDLTHAFSSDVETLVHSRNKWFREYEIKFALISIANSQKLI